MRTAANWILTIAAAAVVVLAFEAEVAKPYRIPSASMEPTLHCARPAEGCKARFDDRVIACEVCYRFSSPHRGQIVVFNAPKDACGTGGTFVKRLIGMPGDDVSERGGYVYINGKKLSEPYIDPRMRDTYTRDYGRVPPGEYFFMGDNRAFSCDSRTWGAVPRKSLIGPVVVTYFPFDRIDSP
jgi:signal peptidase I